MNYRQNCEEGLNNLKKAADNVTKLLNRAQALRRSDPKLELIKLKYLQEIAERLKSTQGFGSFGKLIRIENLRIRKDVERYVSETLSDTSVDDIMTGFQFDVDEDSDNEDVLDSFESQSFLQQRDALIAIYERSGDLTQFTLGIRALSERFNALLESYTTQTETGFTTVIPAPGPSQPAPIFQQPVPAMSLSDIIEDDEGQGEIFNPLRV